MSTHGHILILPCKAEILLCLLCKEEAEYAHCRSRHRIARIVCGAHTTLASTLARKKPEYMHTASIRRRDRLILAQVRHKARAFRRSLML